MSPLPSSDSLISSWRSAGRLTLALALVVVSCGSESAQPDETQPDDKSDKPLVAEEQVVDGPVVGQEAEAPEPVEVSAADPVDLTGALLTGTDGSCTAYVGSYISQVEDVSTGNTFTGELEISADADMCTLVSNQIPNHTMGEGANFANDAGEVQSMFSISSSPQLAATVTPLNFTANAVMLNGVIWEAYPAACFGEGRGAVGQERIGCGPNQLDNPWRYNVGSPLNGFGLDAYSAHAQANGLYHYHSTPEALYEIDCESVSTSPVIGFAPDGFPIYGPCIDVAGQIRAAESSFELRSGERADVAGFTTPYIAGVVATSTYNGQFVGDYQFVEGAGDLDPCNGMTVDGQYGYRITGEYPYVLGCYSGTPSQSFGVSPTETSDGGTSEGALSVDADPSNALRVSVTVDETSTVTFSPSSGGAERSIVGTGSFTVAGLMADTQYEFEATSNGSVVGAAQFTTGSLPAGVPTIDSEVPGVGDRCDAGITVFAPAGDEAPYVGFDDAGNVVWYAEAGLGSNRDPVARNLGNGEALLFGATGLEKIDLNGGVIETWDLSSVRGWHHDAIALADGGAIVLSSETRTIDGSDVKGDTMVELDANGQVVWDWSSFDHLDGSRFPGELSQSEARSGGTDWTHANSIFRSSDGDEILLSLRSQGWVVSISYPDGQLRWIAGSDAGADSNFQAPFLQLQSGTWPSGQHAATYTDDGDLLIYDNRNETGGDDINSRAVRYQIDSTALTATQVFEAIAPKYTQSLGDVDELANGNLLYTAGGPGSSSSAHFVEVDPQGKTVWEASTEERVYRAERFTWADLDDSTLSNCL